MPFIIIGAALVIFTVVVHLKKAQKRSALKAALARPFPDEWDRILKNNFPPYSRLPASLRDELQAEIKVFLAEKRFEGCGGQEITDEVRVTVAAQACMLLLNRKERGYPRLKTILIYPSTYVAGAKGLFSRENQESARLGESWQGGSVVLSWSSAKQGAFNFEDGHNVVMHEFAHQLDQESGSADGAPILERRSAYSSWAKILSAEYEQLKKKTRQHKRDVLDSYGSTNPAEFFAVATETFYEKPKQLKKKHPELYEELKSFYRLDPIEWS